MKPKPPDPMENAQDQITSALRTMEGLTDKLAELVKLQISFFDKLIILNGGTLAVSFTAATGFHTHFAGKQPVAANDLFSAWQLLIISIVLSLVSNWLNMSYILNTTLYITTRALTVDIFRAQEAQQLLEPEVVPTPLDVSPEKLERDARNIAIYNGAQGLAMFFGLISQGATFLSYISLFKFARANFLNS
jgi:hypothetical protein